MKISAETERHYRRLAQRWERGSKETVDRNGKEAETWKKSC